jgi:hypothetical protein
MAIDNHPIEQEELMAYLDGELPVDRAAEAAAHLERCGECQRLADDLRTVSRRLTSWEIPPPGERLEVRQIGPRKRRRWPWIAAAAACLLAVGVFTQGQWHRIAAGPQGVSVDSVRQFDRLEHFAKLQTPPSLATNGPLIVRTASLTLYTTEFDKTRAGLDDILKRHHGYIANMSVSTPDNGTRTLNATLRLPADQLDSAMAEMKKIGRVAEESQGGEEVTQQYVDLEARLSNAQNTEKRLTDLLRDRTGKLSDVLAVEVEIGRVRGQIEQMEAERKSLANRITYATLNAVIAEEYKAQLHVMPDSTAARLRNAAIEGYRRMAGGVVDAVLFVVSFGPAILLWGAILFFPVRFLWKRYSPRPR